MSLTIIPISDLTVPAVGMSVVTSSVVLCSMQIALTFPTSEIPSLTERGTALPFFRRVIIVNVFRAFVTNASFGLDVSV